MISNLAYQSIDGFKTLLDQVPSMMRRIGEAHETPARIREARHIISELARLQIAVAKWAGEEEWSSFDIKLAEIMERFEDQFACDEAEWDQRADEFMHDWYVIPGCEAAQ